MKQIEKMQPATEQNDIDDATKPAQNSQPDKTPEKTPQKLTVTRRKLPTWVVILFCFTAIMLLIASIMELPGHLRGPWYSAAFGIFKVVLWGIMTIIYIPDVISRFKAKT